MDMYLTQNAFNPPSNVRKWDDFDDGLDNNTADAFQPACPKRRRLADFGACTSPPCNSISYDGYTDLPLAESGIASWQPTKLLKVPDVIEALARQGELLRYDPTVDTYTVVDGPRFDKAFNALRVIRGKRNDAAKDRPFSRMHRYFVLLQGEKWAGTGSVFAPKRARPPSPSSPSSVSSRHPSPPPYIEDPACSFDLQAEHAPVVDAAQVALSITKASGEKEVVSLQYLLNMCGAAEMHVMATSDLPSHPLHAGFRILSSHCQTTPPLFSEGGLCHTKLP